MSIAKRQRVLRCYVEPILMYGCETWTIIKPNIEENRSSGNVVFEANVKNTMDCRENKCRSNGRSWTHKIISQQNKKTASYAFWSHIEKERIGTPCNQRENGGEMRKRKAEGTDDRQSC